MSRHQREAAADSAAAAVMALGFSQYEARAYAGLVGRGPTTGYELGNLTGIPQAKVYETLRRLERRGAVVRAGQAPAAFVALPVHELISALEEAYRQRLAEAERQLSISSGGEAAPRVLQSSRRWEEIAARARALIARATHHVYVSLHAEQLPDVADALIAADQRDVRVDVVHFGPASLEVDHGLALRHRSTDGVIYRHRQGRHLALAADRGAAVWALAPDGDNWDAISVDDDPLVTAAVRGFIRHDLYVQRIFADFTDELRERYGPSLHGLTEGPAPALDEAQEA